MYSGQVEHPELARIISLSSVACALIFSNFFRSKSTTVTLYKQCIPRDVRMAPVPQGLGAWRLLLDASPVAENEIITGIDINVDWTRIETTD